MKWTRTCQECGHKVVCKKPPLSHAGLNRYLERKCPKCKSIALDYGSEQ